ncbi:MAG: Fe-S-containing hydro-lyase [Firmicutes bacterium]|nr:Fe-S-containing hydro-lyase [Bacillota bacterium]
MRIGAEDPIKLTTPLDDADVVSLRSGDRVRIHGFIYTARDAAHARLIELIREGGPLPFSLEGQVIYYAGPAPARPGMAVGPCGPTTSYRMDAYAPALIEHGLRGMIGKGSRGEAVKEAMRRHRAVYFAAVGGAAALLSRRVRACELVAYEDLGPEAIYRLQVEDFPVVVINDIYGGDLYEAGLQHYRRDRRDNR